MQESSGFKQRFVSQGLWVFLGLSLLVGAFLGAKPAWHGVKSWRAQSTAQKGLKAIEEKKWEVAYQQADLALQLDPKNDDAWRIMARVYTAAGMDRAIFYWQELENRKVLSDEDRAEYLGLLLSLKRLDLATIQWEELLKAGKANSTPILDLGLRYFLLKNDLSSAISLLKGVQGKVQNPVVRLQLGQLLISSSLEKERQEGAGLLKGLLQDSTSIGLQAAESLIGLSDLPEAVFVQTIKGIREHSLYSFKAELRIVEMEITRKPKLRAAKVEKLLSEWECRIQAEDDRVFLGRWLNREKLYEATLKWAPEKTSKGSRSLLLIRLDALAALKNWSEILKTLDLAPLPLDPYLIELFRARCWMELKKDRDADASWEKTFHLIRYQPQPLFFVGDYAIQIGAMAQARRAFEQIARFPHYAFQAHQRLLNLAEKEENFPAMAEHLKKIRELQPELMEAQNDLIYVDLLLDQNVSDSLVSAKKLVQNHPDLLSYRTTLALAYLKTKSPQEALKVYQGLSIDWKSASPVARWIFYLTLKANREEAYVKKFEEYVKGITLRKQERDLLLTVVNSKK